VKLLEYEAKQLLRSSGIPVPSGVVLASGTDCEDVDLPAVVKSQVPTGGRGKAGGVKIVTTSQELAEVTRDLFLLDIKGYHPNHLLAEQLLAIKQEFYLSLIINRERGCVELVAHREGGIEVESHQADDFFHHKLDGKNSEGVGDSLADYLDLPDKSFLLQSLVENLYRCFITNDATLLEINPLVLADEGELVAGDCKMVLDDSAAYRHPDWNFEDRPADANFVILDHGGTVATIANGAGLAMATVDAVKDAGLIPANFLDIGGGATTEKVVESFRKIMEFPSITSIVINIFGGIVRCDTVARAIIAAREQFPNLPTLYIRLSGNRSQEAAVLLQAHGLPLYETLEQCLEELHV
jgi:succinyl-CoA synthetase beta subunit